MNMKPNAEHYVDYSTYAFSHGPELLVVLTAGPSQAAAEASGNATAPPTYPLTGMGHLAGARLCDALRSGVRAGLERRCRWRAAAVRGAPQPRDSSRAQLCGDASTQRDPSSPRPAAHPRPLAAVLRGRAGRRHRRRGAQPHQRAPGPGAAPLAAPRRLLPAPARPPGEGPSGLVSQLFHAPRRQVGCGPLSAFRGGARGCTTWLARQHHSAPCAGLVPSHAPPPTHHRLHCRRRRPRNGFCRCCGAAAWR